MKESSSPQMAGFLHPPCKGVQIPAEPRASELEYKGRTPQRISAEISAEFRNQKSLRNPRRKTCLFDCLSLLRVCENDTNLALGVNEKGTVADQTVTIVQLVNGLLQFRTGITGLDSETKVVYPFGFELPVFPQSLPSWTVQQYVQLAFFIPICSIGRLRHMSWNPRLHQLKMDLRPYLREWIFFLLELKTSTFLSRIAWITSCHVLHSSGSTA